MTEKKKKYDRLTQAIYQLTIVFVVLKLCIVIDWSWWWVLSPIWIAMLAGLLGGICSEFAETKTKE